MKKIVALIVMVLLVVTIVGVSFAAQTVCDRMVNGSPCNRALTWRQNGRSKDNPNSHTYGGFLGIGKKTCNYQYYEAYCHLQCSLRHVQDMKTVIVEHGHVCGK